MLVLHKCTLAPPPIALQLSMVPSPINLQSPVLWGLNLPEQFPRNKCTRILSNFSAPSSPLSIFLSPTYGLGCMKGLDPSWSQLCSFILFTVLFFSSPGIEGLFCGTQATFRVSCIRCNCFLDVYVGENYHNDLFRVFLPLLIPLLLFCFFFPVSF